MGQALVISRYSHLSQEILNNMKHLISDHEPARLLAPQDLSHSEPARGSNPEFESACGPCSSREELGAKRLESAWLIDNTNSNLETPKTA